MNPINNIMPKLLSNKNLTILETKKVFEFITSGNASDIEMAAFLATLSMKGVSSNELVGATKSLFPYIINPLKSKVNTIDIVGTGGDGLKTYNISTAVSFIVASNKDTYVAKHGNTAVSSQSGASDVLTELGININLNDKLINECLNKTNMCFLFAPNYNKAFKNVAKVRKELMFRTIFNLLGPLLNPARAKRQLLGVFSEKYVLTIAKALKELKSIKAWVVNGSDGMDEITLTGKTKIAELNNNQINQFEINPTKYNFKLCNQSDLKGGSPSKNAKKIKSLFKGETGHYRNIVILNAAAAFCISDSVKKYEDGIDLATYLIDNGDALNTLNDLIKITNK
tara:strand:- start:51 stop:1070 length:1020 start_codon:yes stop_codon:yes gene_type:complete